MLVPMSYEKMPKMCFKCGKILYLSQGCTGGVDGSGGQFGPWLRVGQYKNKWPEESRKMVEEMMSEEGC